jgi:two-component system, OmpR family, response regulator RegX3
MRQRIVIVEDDVVNAKVLRFILEDDGFETVAVPRASQAFAEVLDRETHLVILDIGLPDLSGFALCQELRARRYCGPLIFLTGRGQLADKLEGFRIGDDDYVVKPFEPLELVARLHSVIRRFHSADKQALGAVVRVEDAELSIGELAYVSEAVGATLLTPTEMRILELLMRNSQIVISRETIIERVWGYDFVGDDNRIDVYMRRLRRKIERDPARPAYLHTVRGLGYVFRVEPPRAAAANGVVRERNPPSLATTSGMEAFLVGAD